MGLSGKKVKQRIGKDPRNLSWVDDASRFGKAYLAKFGWDASKGLGTSGEGRTTAIKASQKLDMLGIGMQHQDDPNGLAWRQNRDFENVLRRLNEGATEATGPFHKARESELLEGDGTAGEGEGEGEGKTGDVGKTDDDDDECEDAGDARKEEEKRNKKRKAAEADEGGPTHKKERERKKRKKSKSKSQSTSTDGDDGHEPSQPSLPADAPMHELGPPAPTAAAAATAADTASATASASSRAPPRTHRARIIAAKRMAAANATALAEILGIPPSSSSTSSSSSPYPSAIATPIVVATRSPGPDLSASASASEVQDRDGEQDLLQKLTTSSQSVGDYFKAKLGAMAIGERQTLSAAGVVPAPAPAAQDGAGDRAGLGLGGGALRVAPLADDEEPMRGGIGASSLMFAAMFAPGQRTTDIREESASAAAGRDHDHDDDGRKAEKKRAKEERRRAREERRRKRAEAGQADGTVRDVPVGEVLDGGDALDAWSEDTHPSKTGELEAIFPTKKRKKGNKDRKSMKHRKAED